MSHFTGKNAEPRHFSFTSFRKLDVTDLETTIHQIGGFPVAGPKESFARFLRSRRAGDDEWPVPFRVELVVQVEESDSRRMVAVEMGDEDEIDLREIVSHGVEHGDGGRTAVEKDGAAFARGLFQRFEKIATVRMPAGGERVPRSNWDLEPIF